MSFLKKLFGGGGGESVPAGQTEEHKGFVIRATPYKEGGQFQLCGVIEKTVDGVEKQHRFVRADRFGSLEEAVPFVFTKGRQIIDEQGETLFS
jgi:hypothetical protein